MFIEAKDDGGGGDSWSYRSCKAPVKSPPTNQHPVFTDWMPFLSPIQQCQSTKWKNYHYHLRLSYVNNIIIFKCLCMRLCCSVHIWGDVALYITTAWILIITYCATSVNYILGAVYKINFKTGTTLWVLFIFTIYSPSIWCIVLLIKRHVTLFGMKLSI